MQKTAYDMRISDWSSDVCSSDLAVLSGEDTLFPLHLVAGARGDIVVTASVLPRPWLDMYAKLRDGKLDEALALHRSLMPLLSLAFSETNPGPLKSVMDLVGVDAPHVLRPLTSPESDRKSTRLNSSH